jgi:20S proteasome subunit alpha 7
MLTWQCVVYSTYGDIVPGHVLCDRVASFVHVFNLYWYVR